MTGRLLAAAIDLGDGMGDLEIRRADAGELELVRLGRDGRRVATLTILPSELRAMADVVELARIQLRPDPGARAPGPGRYHEETTR